MDASLDEEGDHTTESSHLLLCDVVLWVALQSWIYNSLDLGVAFKEFRDDLSTLAGSFHSDLQGLETSESQIAVEGTWGSSDGLGSEEELVSVALVVGDEASHDDIRVTTDVLGDRVNTDISTEEKRALQVWRWEGVINSSDDSLALGKSADSFDVADLEGWVSWSFDPDELGVLLNGLLDVLDISHIDEGEFNAVLLLTDLSHVSLGTSIDIIAADNVVTNTAEGLDDAGGGSATTGESHTVLTVFGSSDGDLEGFSGWVAASGIVEFAKWFTWELLGIGGRQVNRDTDASVDWIRFLTSVDSVGSETSVLLDEAGAFVLLDKFFDFRSDAVFWSDVAVVIH